MFDFINYHLLNFVALTIKSDKVGIPDPSGDDVLNGVLTTIYTVAGIAAVISIIIGGIMYSISQGDQSKVKYAKDIILYAMVGLVVVVAAFTITGFILGRF